MCKALDRILRIVEGARSDSARSLRHIASSNETFIGSVKGGLRKMKNYDEGKITKPDSKKIAENLIQLFVKKPPLDKSNEGMKAHLKSLVNTETDSPAFQ